MIFKQEKSEYSNFSSSIDVKSFLIENISVFLFAPLKVVSSIQKSQRCTIFQPPYLPFWRKLIFYRASCINVNAAWKNFLFIYLKSAINIKLCKSNKRNAVDNPTTIFSKTLSLFHWFFFLSSTIFFLFSQNLFSHSSNFPP